MRPTTLLLADDHAVVLEGLRRILDRPEFEIVGAVQDGRALVQAAAELKPDIVIADIGMPLLNGIEAVRQILKNGVRPKIVFLTMHPEAIYAVQAMRAGAAAYILKHAAGEELLTAIREVLAGRTYVTACLRQTVADALRHKKPPDAGSGLTTRQREVLQLLAEGRQAKEIAGILHLSHRTVEFHKYRIMHALGVRSTAELAAYAVRQGIAS